MNCTKAHTMENGCDFCANLANMQDFFVKIIKNIHLNRKKTKVYSPHKFSIKKNLSKISSIWNFYERIKPLYKKSQPNFSVCEQKKKRNISMDP